MGQIIGLGVYGSTTAYLSDPWNRLDAFCVFISYVTLSMNIAGTGGDGDSAGRILRVLRTLRPLRMVNKNERIQLVFGLAGVLTALSGLSPNLRLTL